MAEVGAVGLARGAECGGIVVAADGVEVGGCAAHCGGVGDIRRACGGYRWNLFEFEGSAVGAGCCCNWFAINSSSVSCNGRRNLEESREFGIRLRRLSWLIICEEWLDCVGSLGRFDMNHVSYIA